MNSEQPKAQETRVCRDGCPYGLFLSADRTYRCRGCHLYADECNCPPEVKSRLLRTLGFDGGSQQPRPKPVLTAGTDERMSEISVLVREAYRLAKTKHDIHAVGTLMNALDHVDKYVLAQAR